MRTNLLKTLLLAVGMTAGTVGAYADEVVLTPTADTYFDWNNKTECYGTVTTLNTGAWNNQWSSSTPGLKSNNSSKDKIAVLKFNIKDYAGKITSATLSVTGAEGEKGKGGSITLGYFDLNTWDETTTTDGCGMNTRSATDLNIHTLGISQNVSKNATSNALTYTGTDFCDFLNTKADENGNVSLILFTMGTRYCTVQSKESDNAPKLTLEYSKGTLYEATFTENNNLNPTVTVYTDENRTNEISSASLSANTTYYYTAVLDGYEDYQDSFTVENENPNISFTMTAKQKVAFTINLVDESDNVIKEIYNEQSVIGVAIGYSFPKYLTDDKGKVTYVCTETTYSKSVTPTEAGSVSVKYKAYAGTAYFVEGEEAFSNNTIVTSGKYSGSKAVRSIASNAELLTVAETGSYKVTYAVASNNTRQETSLSVIVNDGEIGNTNITWSVNYVQSYIQNIEGVTLVAGDIIKVNPGSSNAILDYMLIEKTGEAIETVAITSAGYATYVTTKAVSVPKGVEAYGVKLDASAKTIETIAAGEVIPAGTAILVKGEEGEYAFAVSAEAGTAIEGNALKAATEAVTANGSQYALAQIDGQVGFYKVQNGVKIPAGKAYLELTAADAKQFYPLGEMGDVTAINGAAAATTADTAAYYTLQGVKTAKPAKGLYIHNGKKVIIK